MTPEGKVKKAIKEWLAGLPNCWFFMPAAHGYGTNGVPDIIGCYRGVFFAVEVKKPGGLNGVTALQRIQINAINHAFGYACVADNIDTVKEMFDRIDIRLRLMGRV